MAVVIRMPEVATGAAEAAIQTWLVEIGSEVSAGQAIVEIETEKAVVEYEAEQTGVLAGILLPAGDAAAVGVPIAVLATGGESVDAALAAAAAEGAGAAPAEHVIPEADEDAAAPATERPDAQAVEPTPAAPEPVAPEPVAAESDAAGGEGKRLFASPLVRKLARERDLDLHAIEGSGPNGRIVRRDLDAVASAPAAETAPAPAPAPAPAAAPAAPAASGAYDDIPHTGMRRAIARRLTESKSTVPHFYLTAEVRVDELLALRARVNEGRETKVSVNDFVVKAVARALRDVPEANAIWTDDATRRFVHADIAVAVSVPSGLLTPVVREADRLSIGELSATIRDLASRAREGRLKQHELEGGSFSVSNLGMYGTQAFSAIINPPHAGILAVGAAAPRPVVDADGQLAVATVMTVTLSADHRVLDGALAAQWLAAFVTAVENPLSILV